MKRSRACTDMLSNENDAFKFSKTEKHTEQHMHHVHIVPGLVELFFFPNQRAVDQKHE